MSTEDVDEMGEKQEEVRRVKKRKVNENTNIMHGPLMVLEQGLNVLVQDERT